jgi:hypothetical protein
MIVAVDARNPLAALCAISGSDVNLLLGLTAWAFHNHDRVLFGFHRGLMSILDALKT